MLKQLKSIAFKLITGIVCITALIFTAQGYKEYEILKLKREKFEIEKAERIERIESRKARLALEKAERVIRMEEKKTELAKKNE